MMKKEHLHLLIDEEIYLISSDEVVANIDEKELTINSEIGETVVEEPETAEETTETKEPITEFSKEKEHVKTQETPTVRPAAPQETKVAYAFFHNTNNAQELDLLDKIIAACKLKPNDYRILKVGQEVAFEKAVVFTKSGPNYYEPTQHERGIVMYSQPLAALIASKEEKGRLWGALQEFVK